MTRTDIDAQDYFGSQQKKLTVADRRPVIRKASDLVGPGIAANAVRITDFNNLLATYDGFFSAEQTALNGPGSGESFVGTVTSDSALGGMQTFSGLSTGTAWQRVFLRNPSDAATIYWGAWEIIGTAGTGGSTFLETLPASIIDAKGDLIVGAADNDPIRKAVGTDGQSLVADSASTGGVTWGARVASVVAGDSITVDSSDPLNPVVSVLGPRQTQWINTDHYTAVATGTQTFFLTHEPIDGTLQIWWGIPQPPTEWSVSGNVVTIPDASGFIKVGHKFEAYYAYDPAIPVQEITIQLLSDSHFDTLALTFVLPDGSRYDVPGVNTSGAGPVVNFGYFVLEDMGVEFKDLTTSQTWIWPDTSHIHRTAISGTDGHGDYIGYQWFFDDGGAGSPDGDFNDIIMEVKAY